MSPAAPISPDDIPKEVKQGLIAGMLGMMGMAVKIILTDEKIGWKKGLMHLFVAMTVSILCGFALDGYIEKKQLLWALNGLSGFMALKIVVFAEAFADAKMQGKLNEAKRASGIKQNGKRRKATRR